MVTPIVLSELQLGKLYSIRADAVDATLQVIKQGQFPTCLLSGQAGDFVKSEDADESEIAFVQLIGWMVSGRDMRTPTGFQLFHDDTQPEGGWLLAVRIGEDFCPQPMLLALDPDITEITPDQQAEA